MKRNVWKANWEQQDSLSPGGQSFTHKVTRIAERDGALYVLKELKQNNDAERRDRMIHEVALLKKLSYPQLAKYVESNAEPGTVDEELYLIMEYIPGPRLTEYVSTRLPSLPDAVKIISGLLNTLEYCHGQDTVHRDIKPDNIILRNSNPDDPVLIDFGLSFNEDTRDSDFETESGQHLGNRFIYLPEYGVKGADKRDKRSDISQCVGVFFYLVTGQHPDHLSDGTGLLPHQRSLAAERIRAHGPTLAEQLNRIFSMGFQTELLRRFQTINVLRTKLEALAKPHQHDTLGFAEVLQETAKSVLETPEAAQADRSQEIRRIASTQFTNFCSIVRDKLKPICADSLNFNVAPRPHSPGFGVPLPHPWPPLWAFGISLHRKYAPHDWIRTGFLLRSESSQFVMSGLVDRRPRRQQAASSMDIGTATEIVRFDLFDQDAPQIITQGFETYFRTYAIPLLRQ